MLRVNLLEDPTFRKDLLDMARGLLRGIAETIIAETIAKEGWLEQRLDSYLTKNLIEKRIEQMLRVTVGRSDWWDLPAITKAVDTRIDAKLLKASKSNIDEQQLRRLIREEMKKCFQ